MKPQAKVKCILLVPAALAALYAAAVAATMAPTLPAVQQKLGAMAVPFVPNAGQWDQRAEFAAQTFAGTLFVTGEGQLVYRLRGKAGDVGASGPAGASAQHRPPAPRGAAWVLTETLVDRAGRPLRAAPRGALPQVGKVSYVLGSDEARHRDGLPAFERVSLGEVYPGVDVQLRATGDNVEKLFTVAPRHDPAAIRVRLEGADALAVGADGTLIAHTGNGPVTYTAPVAFQEDAAGRRTPVAVQYALAAGARTYGFRVGDYDATRALVIDPLLQSTYLGGSGSDALSAMAIHPASGDVYVVGHVESSDFPKVAGAEQTTLGGSRDAFVTRLNAALTTRLQSTYLGGSGDEGGYGLAIHPVTGEVYVAGGTSSADFPKLAGAEQTVVSGIYDAYVTRLNSALTLRLQSTLIGGSDNEFAFALAINPVTGDIYVTGSTVSSDFPKVAGAEQTGKAAGQDGFVTRLDAALTTRLQSTYVGGDNTDAAVAIAVHPLTGEVYVAGETASTDFPKTAGAEQPAFGGSADGFVVRLNAALTSRLQATYLGGSQYDTVSALAIHPVTGDVYVAGMTVSTDFPKVAGAEQPSMSTSPDAFVTRLSAALNTRIQSTYIGGDSADRASAIAIHPLNGEVYVAGLSLSSDFPKTAGAAQSALGGDTDAFVTRLNPSLTVRAQSTLIGGSAGDAAVALAFHPVSGEAYVAGYTTSTDFPLVAGSEQTAAAGYYDGFISRLSSDLRAGDAVPNPFAFAPRLNVPPGSVQNSAGAQILGIVGLVPISISGGVFGQYCISSSAACTCDVVPFAFASGTVAPTQYVCVRQQAPLGTPGVNRMLVTVGGGMASFTVTTGNDPSACSLDVDGNGGIDALTDGLLVLRAMFGLTGTSVTSRAVGAGAARMTWAQIQPYLNGNCGASFAP